MSLPAFYTGRAFFTRVQAAGQSSCTASRLRTRSVGSRGSRKKPSVSASSSLNPHDISGTRTPLFANAPLPRSLPNRNPKRGRTDLTLANLASLLDLLATALRTSRLKQQRPLLASISIRVQAAAAIRSRHAACSSQQAVTSSARLHTAGTSSSSTQHATDVQRKNALPAPLDHRMGAGPDIDAAEAHRVPGRHWWRHERASCGCGRDRGVRQATDRPTRRRDPLL